MSSINEIKMSEMCFTKPTHQLGQFFYSINSANCFYWWNLPPPSCCVSSISPGMIKTSIIMPGWQIKQTSTDETDRIQLSYLLTTHHFEDLDEMYKFTKNESKKLGRVQFSRNPKASDVRVRVILWCLPAFGSFSETFSIPTPEPERCQCCQKSLSPCVSWLAVSSRFVTELWNISLKPFSCAGKAEFIGNVNSFYTQYLLRQT